MKITGNGIRTKIKELEKDRLEIDRSLKALRCVLKLEGEGPRKKNVDYVIELLKEDEYRMSVTSIFNVLSEKMRFKNKSSFYSAMNTWSKSPKVPIERVGFGLYQFTG